MRFETSTGAQTRSAPAPRADTLRQAAVHEPELERKGRRLGRPGWWFLAIAIPIAIPGALLVALANSWAWALGIVLCVLAGPPAVVGLSLLLTSLVSRWAARHRPFA
jgi:hypothetical protein